MRVITHLLFEQSLWLFFRKKNNNRWRAPFVHNISTFIHENKNGEYCVEFLKFFEVKFSLNEFNLV